MKMNTIDPIIALNRWMRFLRQMLMVALFAYANVLPQSSPAPVNLGTSGDFVILAKTGISTTGVTSIIGDIGVSPIDCILQ